MALLARGWWSSSGTATPRPYVCAFLPLLGHRHPCAITGTNGLLAVSGVARPERWWDASRPMVGHVLAIARCTLTLLILGASDLSWNSACVRFSVCVLLLVWDEIREPFSLFIVSQCCPCFREFSLVSLFCYSFFKKKMKKKTWKWHWEAMISLRSLQSMMSKKKKTRHWVSTPYLLSLPAGRTRRKHRCLSRSRWSGHAMSVQDQWWTVSGERPHDHPRPRLLSHLSVTKHWKACRNRPRWDAGLFAPCRNVGRMHWWNRTQTKKKPRKKRKLNKQNFVYWFSTPGSIRWLPLLLVVTRLKDLLRRFGRLRGNVISNRTWACYRAYHTSLLAMTSSFFSGRQWHHLEHQSLAAAPSWDKHYYCWHRLMATPLCLTYMSLPSVSSAKYLSC